MAPNRSVGGRGPCQLIDMRRQLLQFGAFPGGRDAGEELGGLNLQRLAHDIMAAHVFP